MAHASKISAVVISVLSAVAGSAFADQPPDVVVSDDSANTAMGSGALFSLTPPDYPGGFDNTASGAYALYNNTYGSNNTANGVSALGFNYNGFNNTASGYAALFENTNANDNSAFGNEALYANKGNSNTAVGSQALRNNKGGYANTAVGTQALFSNTSPGSTFELGNLNTAIGAGALYYNQTGDSNTASGAGALYSNTIGSNNIAVGYQAGASTTGDNNIDIGNLGQAGESGTIRIGTPTTAAAPGQTAIYIAGISSSTVTGRTVHISSTGQLGVVASSERYKTAITTMGSRTGKLRLLRPVTFRLKNEPRGELQYGLIAEEVDKVYPELVVRDEAGKIEGVRYDELAPMLLNELQQQQLKLAAQAEHMAAQQRNLAALVETITAQAQQLHDIQLQVAEVKELKQKIAALKGTQTVGTGLTDEATNQGWDLGQSLTASFAARATGRGE